MPCGSRRNPESVADAIRTVIADPRITLSVVTPALVAPHSPPTTDILEMVKDISRSLWPEVIVLPEMSAGATDSVYPRSLGIPSYGIDGTFDDLDDARSHGRDERISVAAFAEELEFTIHLCGRLVMLVDARLVCLEVLNRRFRRCRPATDSRYRLGDASANGRSLREKLRDVAG